MMAGYTQLDRSCLCKVRYDTPEKALEVAKKMKIPATVYRCHYGNHWHICKVYHAKTLDKDVAMA
ncbi:MAG: hypothetical protein C5B44_05615 [Acidobacteria bacterium]|nr:MAG: hypothetical protein C5B44_05615 [Acidobacteriota bacterium]